MNWLYPLSRTEFIFILLFVGFYVLYIWRTFRLARQLNTSAWGVIPKFFLRGSYLTLLIIALLGPSFGEAEGDLATTGHDTFLIVDISRSMDANDVVPTRLERVKYDIQQLCDTLPATRFGLVLASSESFILSPLTADQDAIKQLMREVHTRSRPMAAQICAVPLTWPIKNYSPIRLPASLYGPLSYSAMAKILEPANGLRWLAYGHRVYRSLRLG